jgi:hypothetical protein
MARLYVWPIFPTAKSIPSPFSGGGGLSNTDRSPCHNTGTITESDTTSKVWGESSSTEKIQLLKVLQYYLASSYLSLVSDLIIKAGFLQKLAINTRNVKPRTFAIFNVSHWSINGLRKCVLSLFQNSKLKPCGRQPFSGIQSNGELSRKAERTLIPLPWTAWNTSSNSEIKM